MGLFNFLKKDDHSSITTPAPPVPPAALSQVSKFDEKLPKLSPATPAPTPKPIAPVAPIKLDNLPLLPPISLSVGLPSASGIASAQVVLPQQTPVASAPRMDIIPPIRAAMSPPIPPQSPIPVRSESKIAIPQVMPTISATKPVSAVPVQTASNLTRVAAASPAEEVLRKVLDELSAEDFDFTPTQALLKSSSSTPAAAPAAKPAPVVVVQPVVTSKRVGVAHIPIDQFDESVMLIRVSQQMLIGTQTINERLGGLESQSKSSADSLAGIMESLQKSLISVDEKLFQVN